MSDSIHTNEAYLLHLLGCALHQERPMEKPEHLDWAEIYHLAKLHSVANVAYYAVEQLENRPFDTLFSQWRDQRDKGVVRNLKQQTELNALIAEFSKHNIRCMPLKGSVLKNYYPRQDMRIMADLDILIDPHNANAVKEIMLANGYTCESFGITHHDVYHKAPIYNVEIHRFLFPDRFPQLHTYYVDGFSFGYPSDDNAYVFCLPPTEFYSLYIAHLYKHYSSSGSGIRSVMDVYVMQQRFKNELSDVNDNISFVSVGLSDFEAFIHKISDDWFCNAQPTEINLPEYGFILNSGTYGSLQNRVLNGIHNNGRWEYLRKRVFLPYGEIRRAYPVLNKLPFLLPLFWIIRLGKQIKNSKRVLLEIKYIFRHAPQDTIARDIHSRG
ncbi:MAG: nucleotidyltransferase family protein [Phocaeicola sp.]